MSSVGARFGRIVREARESSGWSQEKLAERAAINRSYLGDIERGMSIPTIATALKVADALGLRLATLIQRLEGVETEAN